jgi:transcriptional antiterminator NusG
MTEKNNEQEIAVLDKLKEAVTSASYDWVLVRSYAKRERSVKANIENRLELLGLHEYVPEIIVPEETFIEVTDGVKKQGTRVRMPGYLLLNMDIYNDEVVAEIRKVNGVVNFAGSYEPIPLRTDEVMNILAPIVERSPELKNKKGANADNPNMTVGVKSAGIPVEMDVAVGEVITITDGPFESMDATISTVDVEHERVTVLVSIFGRETPVDLHITQIRKQA